MVRYWTDRDGARIGVLPATCKRGLRALNRNCNAVVEGPCSSSCWRGSGRRRAVHRMTDLAAGVVCQPQRPDLPGGPAGKAGLVERSPSADDERSVTVTITDAGRTLLAAVLPGHVELRGLLFEPLSRDDVKALAELLEPVRDHMRPPRPGRQHRAAARADVTVRFPEHQPIGWSGLGVACPLWTSLCERESSGPTPSCGLTPLSGKGLAQASSAVEHAVIV